MEEGRVGPTVNLFMENFAVLLINSQINLVDVNSLTPPLSLFFLFREHSPSDFRSLRLGKE